MLKTDHWRKRIHRSRTGSNYKQTHLRLTLSGLYVSANGVDLSKPIAALHGKLAGLIDMPVQLH